METTTQGASPDKGKPIARWGRKAEGLGTPDSLAAEFIFRQPFYFE
jgi:hypothetical protein